MNMHKAFSKSTDGNLGRSFAFRESKSISRISVYSNKDKCCAFHDESRSSTISLLPGLRGMVPYKRFGVGLCCWQIGNLAVAVTRPALVSWSPCCWVHVYPPSLSPQPLCSWALWRLMAWEKRWLRNDSGVHRTGHLIHLIIQIFLCWGYPSVGLDMRHKDLNVFTHSERSIHIPLSQTSLSPVFQLCSFQVTI